MFKKNYRIGQKIIIRDSGRFLAAMSELVRFLLLLGSYYTVKPTTTTTYKDYSPRYNQSRQLSANLPKNYVFNTKAVITPPIPTNKVPAHVNNIFSILSI